MALRITQSGFAGSTTSQEQMIVAQSEQETTQETQAETRPQPSSLERFQGSVYTFRALGEKWLTLNERVKKGIEFNKVNPGNLQTIQLLNALKKELADVQARLDGEAEVQHEAEKQVAGLGQAVCTLCWSIYGLGGCECWKGA